MTPTKYEITKALEKIDHEIAIIEISQNIGERARQHKLSDWCGVRKVLTDLLRDVAILEGKL